MLRHGMAAIDVVVGQAEALGAEDEGDPLAAGRQRREAARAARAFGGPKSRGVIAVAQT